MPSDPPLTDEEICRKFGTTVDHPDFVTARLLAHSRHDRIICVVPECKCPHCGHDFTATFHDLGGGDICVNSNELACPGCERSMYVESLTDPEDEDYDGAITVTLCTDPEPTE